MSKRRGHYAAFKARVALVALKRERTVSELAAAYGVHPTMIHQWKKSLLEGAAGIFERGGKVAPAQIDEDTVGDLHAKIVGRARGRHWFEKAGERCGQRFFVTKAQAMDRQMRRRMIEPDHPALPIRVQCRLLSISRSSFYYSPLGEMDTNLAPMLLIDRHFLDTPFFCARQMTWHLRNEGHPVNEKRIRRLMRLMGLMPIYQVSNTSKPAKGHKTYPYLLRGLQGDRPNQVWCADITYIPMKRGFLYLVAIKDWRTRKVLAWCNSNTQEADVCVEALNGGDPPLWCARYLEHGSGLAVHIIRLDRPRETGGLLHLDGRQGPLHR